MTPTPQPDPLDALLERADTAILTALDTALDLDAGRAQLFASTVHCDPISTPPGPGPGQPYDRSTAPAGILHWAELIDTSTQVTELLGALATIMDRLERLREWLASPTLQPLAPGRTETAAVFLAALTLGVKERGLPHQRAHQLLLAAATEVVTLHGELGTDHTTPGWAWADSECRHLQDALTDAQRLTQALFAGDPPPLATR
ncbi:hypothetical protein [Streptomyces sp. NPDC057702]|uniref:hypothetical protein n=1 Tax=Streptomyces sp. NPDC057702 TaxID=3346221 RepID=UPI0036CEB98C